MSEDSNANSRKIFIIDTSVAIANPYCLSDFGNNDVVIPLSVLEEIDGLKKNEKNGVRQAAQSFIRILGGLSIKGELNKGIRLPKTGGMVRVSYERASYGKLQNMLETSKKDNNILLVAKKELEKKNEEGKKQKNIEEKKSGVVLVSKDINLRVKASVLGICAEDYEKGRVELDENYKGFSVIKIKTREYDLLDDEKIFIVKDLIGLKILDKKTVRGLIPNQFVIFQNDEKKHYTVFRKGISSINTNNEEYNNSQKEKDRFEKIDLKNYLGKSFIYPKNKEQAMFFHHLLDPNIKIITAIGKAGTGKTLLALCAAYEQLKDKYDRIIVFRPHVEVSSTMGFLPGTQEEKFHPWIMPIVEAMDLVLANPKPKKNKAMAKEEFTAEKLLEKKLLIISPLNFIRGLSLHKSFIIGDEIQNMTPHEITTLATRVGENSKLVLSGDIKQVDHPYIDTNSNGLSFVIDRFRGQQIYSHIELTKSERSPFAELAANILS